MISFEKTKMVFIQNIFTYKKTQTHKYFLIKKYASFKTVQFMITVNDNNNQDQYQNVSQ